MRWLLCTYRTTLASWADVVVAAARFLPAWDVRLASAVAIRQSAVLCFASEGSAHWDAPTHTSVSLRVLLALIELLYDTDDEVRDAARCAIDDALAVCGSFPSPPGGRIGARCFTAETSSLPTVGSVWPGPARTLFSVWFVLQTERRMCMFS
jgi:hypothetical protein